MFAVEIPFINKIIYFQNVIKYQVIGDRSEKYVSNLYENEDILPENNIYIPEILF